MRHCCSIPPAPEVAFYEWSAVPDEIIYDPMKTVWTGVDEGGRIICNAIFLNFACYSGFTPKERIHAAGLFCRVWPSELESNRVNTLLAQ